MFKLATMSSACPDWTLDQIIAGMQRHGYQGLEPRVEWGHACGLEADLKAAERKKIKKKMNDQGLEICCIATGVRMAAPDPQERRQHVEDLKRYLDLAADLGCGLVRTFGGQRARDRELQMVVEYVVEGYLQVLDQAEEQGVIVLLETHDDWSCSAPVRAVIEQAGHPNLRALWDFMHPQRMMEKPEETFQALGPYAQHMHIHDGAYVEGRIEVGLLGEGMIEHEVPLRLLNEAGYDGYLSVEVIHQPGSRHDADGVLKQYAEKLRELVAGL
jgi:sugar phosphate isomerase/epimerase